MQGNTLSFENQSQLNPSFSAPRRVKKRIALSQWRKTPTPSIATNNALPPHLATPPYAKSKTTPTGQQKQSLSRTKAPTVCPYSPSPKRAQKKDDS